MKCRAIVIRPFGTQDLQTQFPALKRRAILASPSGTNMRGGNTEFLNIERRIFSEGHAAPLGLDEGGGVRTIDMALPWSFDRTRGSVAPPALCGIGNRVPRLAPWAKFQRHSVAGMNGKGRISEDRTSNIERSTSGECGLRSAEFRKKAEKPNVQRVQPFGDKLSLPRFVSAVPSGLGRVGNLSRH